MHSCFVTEVGIYKDAGIQATSTENSRVKPYNSGIVDAKLQQFFERASSELREKRDTSDESSIRHRLIDDGERVVGLPGGTADTHRVPLCAVG